jgi:hypothetical protein
MADTGVYVNISDYGDKSRNIEPLIEKLKENNISYWRNKTVWYNMRILESETTHDPWSVFADCVTNQTTYKDAKLYRCPFLAHAEKLRAVPSDRTNSIDFTNPDITKEQINRYLGKEAAPSGCAYCGGYGFQNLEEIPVAEQALGPVLYRKFKDC